jgi:hypothetical protein
MGWSGTGWVATPGDASQWVERVSGGAEVSRADRQLSNDDPNGSAPQCVGRARVDRAAVGIRSDGWQVKRDVGGYKPPLSVSGSHTSPHGSVGPSVWPVGVRRRALPANPMSGHHNWHRSRRTGSLFFRLSVRRTVLSVRYLLPYERFTEVETDV